MSDQGKNTKRESADAFFVQGETLEHRGALEESAETFVVQDQTIERPHSEKQTAETFSAQHETSEDKSTAKEFAGTSNVPCETLEQAEKATVETFIVPDETSEQTDMEKVTAETFIVRDKTSEQTDTEQVTVEIFFVQDEASEPGSNKPQIQEPSMAAGNDTVFQDDVKASTDGLEGKPRTWRSAPPSPISERRGLSASLLSLHTEQFLDLLSTAQTRRLEEQRAELPPPRPRAKRHFSLPTSRNLSLPTDDKGLLIELHRRRGGSWTGRSLRKKPAPLKIPAQEELYNTIIGHQAQRMEDQRCSPPLPQSAADLFEILFRVQGNRLDEQRVEMPPPLGGAC
ncbi:hypothetical protein XENTR_v10021246 [Xenopus tropicalis]|uniref:G-protein-signaling modulator 3 n=1 Tax=Xenopus tropicalis TaxID=8364 RepID=A0A8J0SW63_XENTR|nr:G-protein-signaling modulator 3 [Xenopus tropicalis]XP_017952039.2 G-protein-signaling modulator 3 [Xenopus tropicalis]KAE8585208.1 hypothetical protein XENTR_v10021246 [Xenopus tropicalis]KAE8585209.1 hypothetical protein XENTR_v10021246 [Xenopus tropicalis]KAE8585210.1 hypothetical protein XENTR_v10021246 [Xenopus tropicalis]KAE8585211.1 hypothetical protein XENTR_v10021246 [Xenopus tropicalis]KAE8585212.1 hypothetical protein XENTR_v10021246 [Xenopus tropicalis]